MSKHPGGQPRASNGEVKAAETMGDRLRRLLRERGISQSELSRRTGVKQQTINYLIIHGGRGSAHTTRLAAALGVEARWLQEGVGPKEGLSTSPALSLRAGDTHWLPRMTMPEVQACIRHGLVPEQVQRSPVSVQCSERALVVEFAGRSMEPTFLAGDELVVDLAVQPEPGDFALFDVAEQGCVIRRYRSLGTGPSGEPAFEAVPSNTDFPVLTGVLGGLSVIGTILELRRRLRSSRE